MSSENIGKSNRAYRNAGTFVFLTFAISWSIAFIAWRAGIFDEIQTFILGAFAFMWGPAFAAILCAIFFHKGHRISVLGLKPRLNRYLFISWVFPLVLVAVSLIFTVLLSDRSMVDLATGMLKELEGTGLEKKQDIPPYFNLLMPLGAATLAAASNSLLLISEELGWRGYLYSQIKHFGLWKTATITGLLWGVWHAPLIVLGYNYPDMPMMGVILMTIICFLISVPMTYLRWKSGSVWSACIFHGTFNAVAPLSIFALSDASMPWRGIMGGGGFLSLIIVIGIVCYLVKADRNVDLTHKHERKIAIKDRSPKEFRKEEYAQHI